MASSASLLSPVHEMMALNPWPRAVSSMAETTSAKNGSVMLVTAIPKVLSRPRRSDLATRLGRYPSAVIASIAFFAVAGATLGRPLTTLEIVLMLSPDTDATSRMVGRLFVITLAVLVSS